MTRKVPLGEVPFADQFSGWSRQTVLKFRLVERFFAKATVSKVCQNQKVPERWNGDDRLHLDSVVGVSQELSQRTFDGAAHGFEASELGFSRG